MLISLNGIKENYSWIEKSLFFEKLIDDYHDELDETFECYVCSPTEKNIEILLNVIRFWDVYFLGVETWNTLKKYKDQLEEILSGMSEDFLFTKKFNIFLQILNSKDCSIIAKNGYLDMLIWANKNNYPWTPDICLEAVKNGYLNCLSYAYEHGCQMNPNSCFIAAEKGYLDCLIYAHEHGCILNRLICYIAAENGHLDCLIYAHKHDCPWNKTTCSVAAKNGHLKCLIYLHENRCPWDADTCTFATMGGHLDFLIYARKNNCHWNKQECLRLTRDKKIKEWILSQQD